MLKANTKQKRGEIMPRIFSETATYEEMVIANAQEKESGVYDQIEWANFTYGNSFFSSSAMKVGKTPDKLVQMGFRDKMIYDKTHFENSMYSSEERKHGHNSTVDDLLSLPRMLENPLAIIKIVSDDETKSKEMLCLLCTDKNSNGDTVYRRAFIRPYDFYNGVTEQYEASKVITFHNMDNDVRFFKKLEDAYNRNEILYFDPVQYRQLPVEKQTNEFLGLGPISKPICGEVRVGDFITKQKRDWTVKVGRTASVEIERVGQGKFIFSDSEYKPLLSAIKTLESNTVSINDLLNAREMIKRTCIISRDKEAVIALLSKTDIMFAKQYVKLMDEQTQNAIINGAANIISQIDVKNDDDVEYMYNAIDKATEESPTLKNLGVAFTEHVASNPHILAAQKASASLDKGLIGRLSDIANQKLDRMEEIEQHREHE